MTRETFIYGLNGCAVTYHNGQKLYEHDDLIKCFEDLGIFEQDPKAGKVLKMRDATPEERELIDKYIKSISKPTGVNFWDLEQEPKWIPVSERLPEDGTYLVTVEGIIDGKPRIDKRSFAKDLNKVDEFDFPKHKCGWYDYDSEYGYWEDIKVIAWMPLLNPYDPQESEETE